MRPYFVLKECQDEKQHRRRRDRDKTGPGPTPYLFFFVTFSARTGTIARQQKAVPKGNNLSEERITADLDIPQNALTDERQEPTGETREIETQQ